MAPIVVHEFAHRSTQEQLEKILGKVISVNCREEEVNAKVAESVFCVRLFKEVTKNTKNPADFLAFVDLAKLIRDESFDSNTLVAMSNLTRGSSNEIWARISNDCDALSIFVDNYRENQISKADKAGLNNRALDELQDPRLLKYIVIARQTDDTMRNKAEFLKVVEYYRQVETENKRLIEEVRIKNP